MQTCQRFGCQITGHAAASTILIDSVEVATLYEHIYKVLIRREVCGSNGETTTLQAAQFYRHQEFEVVRMYQTSEIL